MSIFKGFNLDDERYYTIKFYFGDSEKSSLKSSLKGSQKSSQKILELIKSEPEIPIEIPAEGLKT